MSEVHFLNVGGGDSIIVKHGSGRITMIDISKGNVEREPDVAKKFVSPVRVSLSKGMTGYPTNPIHYLNEYFPGESIFRFVLSHPDMDHLDGLDSLWNTYRPLNFWDSGVRRTKPEFGTYGGYNESDWSRYESVINERESKVTVVTPKAGSRFQFANRDEAENSSGDGLYVLAPTGDLVKAANQDDDVNDASYVLQYESVGGLILFPGDAHDATWEYVLANSGKSLAGTSVLIAPHHGRRSDRVCDFLDVLRPQLTLFGCAPDEDMMYDECTNRRLPYISNSDAGNIVLEAVNGTINVFVQNVTLAEKLGAGTSVRNRQGYYLIAELADLRSRNN